ncbi:MAG: HAD-IA family hydrolase [Candidatus Marinimicrobia bacterium]|jgi:putative hydrolase of the HAD superfamily|nr:HAD-IA family hydrolase [Candidatus Neomarinimicrobiota bacterium]MDD4961838.1 HAD-IA family hydrolase [Candidatus Neomarinimicrobiota bacterium]MDX9777254.1 HAD-IA family hydrolase [bacterium]
MNICKYCISDLVFDLGNVLVAVDYRRFTDFMDWDYDQFMRFLATDLFRDFECGRRTEAECFREMAKFLSLKESDIPRYRANIHRAFPLWREILELLPELRKKYRLYLFSNTNSLDFNAISRHIPFRELFDGVYTSFERGYLKPGPEAYEHIMRLFSPDPGGILYFDDRPENIEAGIRAGWQSVRIENRESIGKIIRDLCEDL